MNERMNERNTPYNRDKSQLTRITVGSYLFVYYVSESKRILHDEKEIERERERVLNVDSLLAF